MDQRILQIIQKHPELKSEFEEIYPELKESEDERIRNVILKLMLGMRDEIFTAQDELVTKPKVLAYLEKQKEQKPFSQEVFDAAKHEALWGETAYNAEDIEELRALKAKIDESMEDPITKPAEKQDYTDLNDLERAIHRGFLSAGVENVPVTIIKETAKECLAQMKPAEWSEDYREEDLRTRFAFYTYKDEDDALYLSNVFVEETSRNKGFGTKILAAAEKVAETLGVIIIRLKVKQNSPANAWYRKHGYGFMAFEGDYDWLEKTLEYMKPVKQEWSEEDINNFNRIAAILVEGSYSHPWWSKESLLSNDEMQKLTDWLKLLLPPFKDREMKLKILKYLSTRCSSLEFEEIENYLNNLRPSWKPGEEQMKWLKDVIETVPMTCRQQVPLESLYNDLLKLI